MRVFAREVDEARQTRALFMLLLALVGVLSGVGFASLLQPGEQVSSSLLSATVAWQAAISLTLLVDAAISLWRRTPLAWLLLKLALFGFNAILLVAELLVLVYVPTA